MCGGLLLKLRGSTVVSIQHGNHDDQQCCHSNRGEKHAIRVVGIKGECPFPQMGQPLQ